MIMCRQACCPCILVIFRLYRFTPWPEIPWEQALYNWGLWTEKSPVRRFVTKRVDDTMRWWYERLTPSYVDIKAGHRMNYIIALMASQQLNEATQQKITAKWWTSTISFLSNGLCSLILIRKFFFCAHNIASSYQSVPMVFHIIIPFHQWLFTSIPFVNMWGALKTCCRANIGFLGFTNSIISCYT